MPAKITDGKALAAALRAELAIEVKALTGRGHRPGLAVILAGDNAASKTLAWRNSWDIPEMTRAIAGAVLERDPAKRAATYEATQREHQKVSPLKRPCTES